jgi:selenide,water dikinase
VLCQLPQVTDQNLLVGYDSFADAAVYRLSDELALVQTLDFFTPVVDDPYLFGQIAAANALSDVYAAGARPLTALNIVCFPSRTIGMEILKAILQGGADKVLEAGALVVGGHSVEDSEPKYGLAVTGIVRPDLLVTNSGARPGDLLVLTKPIGTGLLLMANKAQMAAADELEAAVNFMKELNRCAAEAMLLASAHAATDITGFGLLGHARELALASNVGLEISFGKVPVLRGTLQAAAMGLVPAGTYANRDYVQPGLLIINEKVVGERELDVLCDPQTSGGLLIAVPPEKEQMLLAELGRRQTTAAVIGRVLPGPAGQIRLVP